MNFPNLFYKSISFTLYNVAACCSTLTFKSSSSGHSDAVNVLILGKHLLNRYRLLQLLAGPVYLLVDGASVYLHLHDVGLLLAFLQKLHL